MLRHAILLTASILALAAAPAFAADPMAPSPAAMAHPAKPFKVLTPADVYPATLIAPPPADGSLQQLT